MIDLAKVTIVSLSVSSCDVCRGRHAQLCWLVDVIQHCTASMSIIPCMIITSWQETLMILTHYLITSFANQLVSLHIFAYTVHCS